jgi:nitroreductase
MEFDDVVKKRRTIRRFKQEPVPIDILRKLIEYARVAPQGSNIQALEYVIISDEKMRNKIFSLVRWAGALPPETRDPEENRRPMAYIVVLSDTQIKKETSTDSGAAVENILLGATNWGLGTCWQGAIDRPKIHKLLDLDSSIEVKYVISIGYPDEQSQVEDFNGDFKYWKSEDGKMHVPKKSLEKIIKKIY